MSGWEAERQEGLRLKAAAEKRIALAEEMLEERLAAAFEGFKKSSGAIMSFYEWKEDSPISISKKHLRAILKSVDAYDKAQNRKA